MHQHLPIFHTEHCVFCRFLSDGNSYLDCGRPCEPNSVHLRDCNGKDHLVLADEGCRNTVFNAQAQSGKHLPSEVQYLEGAHSIGWLPKRSLSIHRYVGSRPLVLSCMMYIPCRLSCI